MNKTAITNGLIFSEKGFSRGIVLIHDDRIFDVIYGECVLTGYDIIDVSDCYVTSGFMDPHVHFRSPGQEYKENWRTGSRAAIKGGFTFVMDMPNNAPAADNADTLKLKDVLAKKTRINYGFYLGLTDTNCGDIESIISELASENVPLYGIKVFLGSSTGDLLVKKDSSITDSLKTGMINLFHCEDEMTLDSYKSVEYRTVFDHNLKRPPAAEVNGIKRIIGAAREIKDRSKIYICHVSSGEELEAIKHYRKDGFYIISEISPHHLFFHLDNISDSNIFKVNPPIRTEEDAMNLRKGFNEGFFDVIGTDHAPHLLKEKMSGNPPSGMPGLETCFYALYDLYEKHNLSLEMAFKLLTSGYKIFGIKGRGELRKGFFADITIIKKKRYKFQSALSETKADFSPFDGMEFNAMIDTVLINGEVVMRNGLLEI